MKLIAISTANMLQIALPFISAILGAVILGLSADVYRDADNVNTIPVRVKHYRQGQQSAIFNGDIIDTLSQYDYSSYSASMAAGAVCLLIGMLVGLLLMSRRYSLQKLQLGDTKVGSQLVALSPEATLSSSYPLTLVEIPLDPSNLHRTRYCGLRRCTRSHYLCRATRRHRPWRVLPRDEPILSRSEDRRTDHSSARVRLSVQWASTHSNRLDVQGRILGRRVCAPAFRPPVS